MPRGLQRYYGGGDLHFITCSCYHRQPFLGTAKRRNLFLQVLEQVRRRYQFVVVGYVVMPEHFHLLISEPQERTPSTVMQALKLGFARRILAEQRRRRHPLQAELFAHAPPHIWQRRFYDFNVWSSRKRAEKLRYIASQSSKTRVGQISGAMALEQLPCLRGGRAGSGERERVASVETEDPPSGSVKLMMPAVSRPTSRKARDVGHPRLFLGSPPPITWATRHYGGGSALLRLGKSCRDGRHRGEVMKPGDGKTEEL